VELQALCNVEQTNYMTKFINEVSCSSVK